MRPRTTSLLINSRNKFNFKINNKTLKTTFNQNEDIDKYYADGNKNYQDNLPFDLFNMVEVVKRLNKVSSLPAIKEYKSEINSWSLISPTASHHNDV